MVPYGLYSAVQLDAVVICLRLGPFASQQGFDVA
jgi:hypothetical protein